MSEPGLLAKYVVDTGFFSDLWTSEGTHPRDLNEGLWNYFEQQVHSGVIVAPNEVREELLNIWDEELDRWVNRHKGIFCELVPPQFEVLSKIVRTYPAYTHGPKDMADPAVVSLAAGYSLTVLTSEKHQMNPSPVKPKIPNLAEQHDVDWCDINGYMRREGIKQR